MSTLPAALNRRQFLHTHMLGLAAFATADLPVALLGQAAADPWHGLKLGVASYSFRKFTLDQAIAMTVELGLKYISLKDVHLPLQSTTAERQEARKKVEAAGLTIISGGVIAMPDKEEVIRNAFQYAKDAGMPTIVCAPAKEAMDTVEKMVKEFDIRIAIHNHGPGDKVFPSPLDALAAVEHRDPRCGLCIDVGHTVRIGDNAVADIQKCASRLFDFHLKDVSAARPVGKAVVIGTGVIDIPAVLKALVDAKFSGHLGIEFEINDTDPLPGMKQSVAYLRKAFATLG